MRSPRAGDETPSRPAGLIFPETGGPESSTATEEHEHVCVDLDPDFGHTRTAPHPQAVSYPLDNSPDVPDG